MGTAGFGESFALLYCEFLFLRGSDALCRFLFLFSSHELRRTWKQIENRNILVIPQGKDYGILTVEARTYHLEVGIMENRILIIEDDAAIAQTLKLNLECAGYAVTSFDNGLTVWNALEQEHNYDLALLDMMLPGVDGFTLLPKLKEYGIPVICLTAMGDAQHEVQGLRGGAEDYIAKPFDMLALLVRMEKILQRTGRLNQVYRFRDLTLDTVNRKLTRNGVEIPLPPLEFDVLAVLMKNKNRTVSRDRILNEIWGQDYFGDIRTVDVRSANLRKKLGLAEEIRTISKAGYRLEER